MSALKTDCVHSAVHLGYTQYLLNLIPADHTRSDLLSRSRMSEPGKAFGDHVTDDDCGSSEQVR